MKNKTKKLKNHQAKKSQHKAKKKKKSVIDIEIPKHLKDSMAQAPSWLDDLTIDQMCLFCGKPDPDIIQIYVPGGRNKIPGAPPGKERGFAFRVHSSCIGSDIEGSATAAEIIVHDQLGDTDFDAGVPIN